MENLLDGWGITLATFSPLVGAAVMMLIPREREDQHKLIALVTSLWVAFVGVLLLFQFDLGHTDRLQFGVDKVWIDVISSRYSVGIDGMSLPLILLTMLVVPLCIVYSRNHFPDPFNPKAFLILILILETGMIGTFVAQDLVLFFVFFEVVLLPMFFMIAVWGGEDRRYASLKFFLYTLFGSALMLVSFLALFFLTGAETFSITGLADAVAAGGVSRTAQLWIFGGMFLGFGIKVPMFPFHFVMLGIATLTDFGINAAIMGMVAHGLITGMLFFLAGSIKERYHTLEISRLGGLLVQAPRMGWIFGFCIMASLGLPGLAGFWGEFPAILSAYNPGNGVPVETFRTFMVIAALGTVLAAGYLLWLLQRTAFGSPTEEFADDPNITDTTKHEWISWAPLLALILAIGIYPNLVFRVTDGAVDASLTPCLTVEAGEYAEAMGCDDVYRLDHGEEHGEEHAAAGN